MIVSFSVENFRSFHSEATFSLVASNRLSGEHGDHAIAIPGSSAKVLRTAVVYGANGAGKSNLFKAVSCLQSIALKRSERDMGAFREPFRFSANRQDPTAFDLQFIAKGKVYRYFIKFDDRRVIEEWLGEIIGERERTVFQRGQDREVALGNDLSASPRLAALATVGAPPDQSFLSSVEGSALGAEQGPDLVAVILWFRGLTLVKPGQRRQPVSHKLSIADPSLLNFVNDFLRASSTGVDRLAILRSEVSREQLSDLLGEDRAQQLLDLSASGRPVFERGVRGDGDAWIEVDKSDGFWLGRLRSVHKGEDGRLIGMVLRDESDGTRRLLELLPDVHQMKNRGGVCFVDEIDRSMHPILVRRLIEYFLASCAGCPGQLIVTTHESNLLDLDLLRRDEIWFAEKDEGQATHLYSLADFKVRKDLNIRKGYLDGRFGAIPFLGSLDALTKGQDNPA